MTKFINLTNHPSNGWSEKQINAAKMYGKKLTFDGKELQADEKPNQIIDYSFPNIPPNATSRKVFDFVDYAFNKIVEMEDVNFVLLQGEFTFVVKLSALLKSSGYKVGCATTERVSVENPDGTKTSKFEFVQFREY